MSEVIMRKNEKIYRMPEYQNSLVSVTNSILKYYGAEGFHESLPLLDEALRKKYKNIIYFIFDGMGVNVLKKHLSSDSFLRTNIASHISSVYPCTTTAALTSIQSGKTPAEHGWLGWSCYFKEHDKCVDLFSSNESGISEGVPAADENLPQKYLGYEDICSLVSKGSGGQVKTFGVSAFRENYAGNCSEICQKIKEICSGQEEKFIYAYSHQPDYDMHDCGIGAENIKDMLIDFDRQIKELSESLSDTLFIISADHGMKEISSVLCVDDIPEIKECLKRRISIECRCCSFYVKDDKKDIFPAVFKEKFGDKFILYTHEEFLSIGLLGGGAFHYKVSDFVGDYVAVAVSDMLLCSKDNNGEFNEFKSAHAGLTSDELTIPLILIEK